MKKYIWKSVGLLGVFTAVFTSLFLMSSDAISDETLEASVCQIAENPSFYNHRLVKVTGDVTQGFENFTLTDHECRSKFSIWVEYGGKRQSATTYCCGVTAANSRPNPLVVEGIPTALNEDENLRRFDRDVHDGLHVKTTIVGRFFSGKKETFPGGTFWVGYGHMGFFSLLVIQEVTVIESSREENHQNN